MSGLEVFRIFVAESLPNLFNLCFSTGANNIQYDGFTKVFTAQALNLAPGQHTIKLAIADIGDSAFDLAVFVQAVRESNSFEKKLLTGTLATSRTISDLNLMECCPMGSLCWIA